MDTPIALFLTFRFSRPKSHFGTRNGSPYLKTTAPSFPTTRNLGDLDKLQRAILDALTSVAYNDDSQVVQIIAHKEYSAQSEPQACLISIKPCHHG
jgi:crossover junction endodeoxyribonuclease RusA